ncbi:hypothetical protein CWB99_05670 [Pseudoalteromonas rubra]|uniref:Uncharacterized protein n=1 Tax=Pseudoalteromonas rubra TaxID=43658 RepID=A0A5S3WPV0_9GAMM|nr:hypothetical protein [Pseudoalteromonas rubra]TMP30822.1 hypothetical protein CWB99_05670 [Pseudoalteromonas rubra]
MKLKLNKNHIKVLSGNSNTLPIMQTPNVAGGKHIEITHEQKYCGSGGGFGCTGGGCSTEV